MERLRRLSWFERIRTGPSPDDDSLLQLTRELALFFDIRFWYKQILWGKFHRSTTGWMISKPVLISPGQVELMLPEFLKGKLSLENWRFLIAIHLVRFKGYNSGRMIKEAGTMFLIILGTFVSAFTLQEIVGGPLGSALFFPVWSPGFLFVSLKLRNGFRKWVFEVDREVANKLGKEGMLDVLDRMESLDPKATPSTCLAGFLAFWSPSINDRVSELRNPRPITLPKRSRIRRIGLRWRGIIIGIGAAIYWSSGFVAAFYTVKAEPALLGRPTAVPHLLCQLLRAIELGAP